MTSTIDLDKLSPPAKMRMRWLLQARPNQLPPPLDPYWFIWMIISGRGFGKTRTGAEFTAQYARENPGARIAIVVPTFAAGRDLCVEGESGLLQVLHPTEVLNWNRTEGRLNLKNGSFWKIYSAEEPERLRGPQHHIAWCEEMAAWKYDSATWDMLMFGLRLGKDPKVVITTTPKPRKLVKELLNREGTFVTRGSTFENAANLAPTILEEFKRRYDGKLLGRQELYGEILEDIEGALWLREDIEMARLAPGTEVPDLDVICVAVDPAAEAKEDSDYTGIIVVGRDDSPPDPRSTKKYSRREDSRIYVLADRSLRARAELWAETAVRAALEFDADFIVYEKNQGGDMVRATIQAALDRAPAHKARRIRLRPVHASKGKRVRAEPVATLYTETGGRRVRHVEPFVDLEDQLTTWVPGESDWSPDRLDALVWGVTALGVLDAGHRRKLHYRQ